MAAATTFAQFFQVNGATQEWTVTNTGTQTTVTASGAAYISFSGVTGLIFATPELATFTLNAVSNQIGNCGVACGPGDSYVQPGYAGTFSSDQAPALAPEPGSLAVLGAALGALAMVRRRV